MKKERLAKVLAKANIASRRNSEKLIFDGKVSVNGEIVLLPQTLVDSDQDQIKVKGQLITVETQKYYFLFHKPQNVFCSNQRKKREKLVIDYFKKVSARLFTAGRLDKDVTGLIIVTNDGHFANFVIHPRYNVEKEYLAKVQQTITAEHLKQIQKGVVIEGKLVKPILVKKIAANNCKITVTDGKKHEVKLFLKKAKLDLRSLSRIRIGPLTLGRLPIGLYRQLKQEEVDFFTKAKN